MKIEQLNVEQIRLSSAEAEMRVTVVVSGKENDTELRGVLHGPFSSRAQTIQIAYPLKPMIEMSSGKVLVGTFLITDPNYWTPETPLTYEGSIEIWHGGKPVDHTLLQMTFKDS